MTVERPKVLLPLVNVPMINYTLEWLLASGVDEVRRGCDVQRLAGVYNTVAKWSWWAVAVRKASWELGLPTAGWGAPPSCNRRCIFRWMQMAHQGV